MQFQGCKTNTKMQLEVNHCISWGNGPDWLPRSVAKWIIPSALPKSLTDRMMHLRVEGPMTSQSLNLTCDLMEISDKLNSIVMLVWFAIETKVRIDLMMFPSRPILIVSWVSCISPGFIYFSHRHRPVALLLLLWFLRRFGCTADMDVGLQMDPPVWPLQVTVEVAWYPWAYGNWKSQLQL